MPQTSAVSVEVMMASRDWCSAVNATAMFADKNLKSTRQYKMLWRKCHVGESRYSRGMIFVVLATIDFGRRRGAFDCCG